MELSRIEGTIGNVIKNNIVRINGARSKDDLYDICAEVLTDLKNKDKDNFLSGIQKSKNFTRALSYVYNYLFKGDNLGVI